MANIHGCERNNIVLLTFSIGFEQQAKLNKVFYIWWNKTTVPTKQVKYVYLSLTKFAWLIQNIARLSTIFSKGTLVTRITDLSLSTWDTSRHQEFMSQRRHQPWRSRYRWSPSCESHFYFLFSLFYNIFNKNVSVNYAEEKFTFA